ncbi:DUF2877 domain-containing protein [Natribacillus halophilus]|uniref:DUF2877 domain-containing protein n=1 Tax=Natribacillus halophilus TaxID=549003 RepID=A0A1G8LYA6_9BACI|nr:DUF2877 domain-containing protein [Natribacillus halophilus]SDI60694.1 Protein of unknown function [Natribacillus halophilus]
MNDSNMLALVASADISRVVESWPSGKVHSLFANSLNLQFGDRLVHVGHLAEGLAPFGIGAERADIERLLWNVRIGELVRYQANQLIFSDRVRLSMNQVDVTDHTLDVYPYDLQTVDENVDCIFSNILEEDWHTGFIETDIKRLLKDRCQSCTVHNSDLMTEKLQELEALAFGRQTTGSEGVFNYWIGRGQGLTPSGDDLLVGMCAAMDGLGRSNPVFLRQLKSYLLDKGHARTTEIGYEYLWYATDKKYHSHVINICKSFVNEQTYTPLEAAQEMKAVGHTSGTDTLIGILIGAKGLK